MKSGGFKKAVQQLHYGYLDQITKLMFELSERILGVINRIKPNLESYSSSRLKPDK